MRAVVFDRFGDPAEVLEPRDVSDPSPGQGEVLVRMLASPVNPSDLMVVRGIYGRLPTPPATPGFEGVGVVEADGGGMVAGWFKNKRVAVINSKGGNWAEKVVIPFKQAVPLPGSLPLDQAATFFVNPAAAYVMTRKVLGMGNGKWLLQTAAGSTLGRMVIRLGRRFGFRTINVIRRSEQADELRRLGADEVVATDVENMEERVREITGGEGAKAAIDCVGGELGSSVIRCLARRGKLLVYGTLSNTPLSFSSRDLMTPGTSVEGFWLANYMEQLALPSKIMLMRTITGLIKDGILESEIGESFALDDIKQAATEAEKVARGGKVLLKFGEA
ncbi:Quinone oxidoreductase 1 [Planctomycetes bacterium Pan216]|uniref:Quinone oxidoreductase 1 n=1 Tax=Kolteria novifilia TaxID=2527975 RepID=A0A518AZH8_9BACT|nr:Quinone oxidoreductase 1 [Planctomycetes bacterium Pan216]